MGFNLKKSPIANISLSSKELFHSNFLSWLFNTYPKMTNAILDSAGLPQLTSNDGVTVTREEQNLDLVIRIGDDRLIIVENKLKSLPHDTQLRSYEEKAKKLYSGQNSPEFILLTLSSKDYSQTPLSLGHWKSVDYSSLIEHLKTRLQAANLTTYHQEVVRDYAAFVSELIRIANDESSLIWNHAGRTTDGKGFSDWLRQHKLHDLFGKRQGYIVASKVHKKIASEYASRVRWQLAARNVKAFEINVYSGFTRGQPLVGVLCALKDLACSDAEDAPPVAVGFQVQGDQFRSFVEWPRPGPLQQKPDKKDFSSKTAAIAWDLFCDKRCPESFWPPKRKSGPDRSETGKNKSRYKEQCRFGAAFQYRYRPLPKEKDQNMTLEQLAEYLASRTVSLLNDLNRIELLLKEHQSSYTK